MLGLETEGVPTAAQLQWHSRGRLEPPVLEDINEASKGAIKSSEAPSTKDFGRSGKINL